MILSDIPTPEIYKQSWDFRFFLKWFETCLAELQYKTDNLIDLLDPLRCPSELLWMLGDTCGYKYDERASVAFNRLVILYFATLIRYRGSKTGMTLAAEINLDQFNLQNYANENPVLEARLEDTSIPVNAVSVTPYVDLGFIDVVYYSEKIPTDVCIEYVRPLGMYCFSHAGVSMNAKTKISVDARLTDLVDNNVTVGPSFTAAYTRKDYASLQSGNEPRSKENVYYRNKDYEASITPSPSENINPGLRSLSSLQLCNNDHIVKALLPSIFDIGYGPQDVSVQYPDDYLKDADYPLYNLRINNQLEHQLTNKVYTIEDATSVTAPKPAVNPVMAALGDAISLNARNTAYTKYDTTTGKIEVVRVDNEELDR